jgi:nitroimidazol reductase NimA-like FMN-containing flavoprotein (pyridoxamine 5'-phosphate oxidase superfamily)
MRRSRPAVAMRPWDRRHDPGRGKRPWARPADPGHRHAYAGRVSETSSSRPEGGSVATKSRGAAEMLELDRAECLRLLAGGTVGRVAVTAPHRPQPVIRPVNYAFDEASQSVLIRSGSGSKLFALLCAVRAVFEVDGVDPASQLGWSVIIEGATEEITDPAELRRLEALRLEPWAPGHKGHWIRIRASMVSGRQIVA